MLLLAHRGASADAPENTREAFEEAMRQAADGVELDAMICASGEVVVCHDEKLDRLAGLDWVIQKTPWARLVEVKLARGTRIPLLQEVLDLLPKDKVVNVELKCETWDDKGLTAAALDVIRKASAEERVVVSSFNPRCLRRLSALAPDLKRGFLIDPDKSWLVHGLLLAPMLSRYSVHPSKEDCTPPRVDLWHRKGLKVAVWTVDDPADARGFEKAGVDYLITNQPRAVREALKIQAG